MPEMNALNGAPPAPNPDVFAGAGGNALTGAAPGGPQQQQAPPQPPAPSHHQVVTALRHFGAIEKELHALLSNEDCGKANIRPQIIDGASKLVSSGMMSAAQAVEQLANVPDRPFDQKAWLQQQYQQAIQAQTAVLTHHGEAFLGQGEDAHGGGAGPSIDDHQSIMAGLMQHYKDRGHG